MRTSLTKDYSYKIKRLPYLEKNKQKGFGFLLLNSLATLIL